MTSSLWANNIMTRVYFSKTKAYINEPIQVSIQIYTPTWFTEGVDIGNIKIDGAFSVYFRSVSTSKTIKGQTWAGVELIYHIFPYEAKTLEFPQLEFDVYSPVPGDYKGVLQHVKTRKYHLHIRPAPDKHQSDWLVTHRLRVYDSWNGKKQSVKVGEILTRTITQKASGTVAELIPPFVWDTLEAVSLYPRTPSVHNYKTKTYISARRTDQAVYLFEKEGTITIPPHTTYYWNPYSKQLNKKIIPAYEVDVLPNPNLTILTSIKDSLEKLNQTDSTIVNEEPPSFFESHKKDLIYVSIGIGGGWLAYKILFAIISRMIRLLKRYGKSEKYYFQKYLFASSEQKALNALYHWLDFIRFKETTLDAFLAKYTMHSSFENFSALNNKRTMRKARRQFLKEQALGTANNNRKDWINP